MSEVDTAGNPIISVNIVEFCAPSEWAVPGFLAEGPTHGFAIARAMAEDGEIGRVWSLRRPRVYYAIDEITPAGGRALAIWLETPVEHIRDARSMLLLKLLFLGRRQADPGPLLAAQRARFEAIAERLRTAADEASGFDRTLLSWRLETATAAMRFIDTVVDARGGSAPPGGAAQTRAGSRAR